MEKGIKLGTLAAMSGMILLVISGCGSSNNPSSPGGGSNPTDTSTPLVSTATGTATATNSPTVPPSTPSFTPTSTVAAVATATSTPTSSASSTPTDTATSTLSPTATNSFTFTATSTVTSTDTATSSATGTPTSTPTATRTFTPTPFPTLASWGTGGSGDGQLGDPSGIFVGSAGNVFVAESANHRIQKFDSAGNYLLKWGKNGGDGTSGSGDGEFNNPTHLAGGSMGLYVADTLNNRVQRFNAGGVFQDKWGSSGTGDGQFNQPGGIAVDSSNYIYVVDKFNQRIQRFQESGSGVTFVSKWGSLGSGDSQFISPSGIAVDNASHIFVADSGNNRIQEFSTAGNLLRKWGKNGGDGTSGSGQGEFNYPSDIAVDSSGNVFVIDSSNHRIQEFDNNGNYLNQWQRPSYDLMGGLCFDASDKLYVTINNTGVNDYVFTFIP